ncbi:MAG: nucleotidyl transferase AbiEii/AbiGii toxin family protein [Crocinitomicaceae bacterium]
MNIAEWNSEIMHFIQLAEKYKVRMLMVGGGAVNFHGYQRSSADIDFWIDTNASNLANLIAVFNEMGYQIDSFPEEVQNSQQNISVKFSPKDLELELITKFDLDKTFDEAFQNAENIQIGDQQVLKWKVLSLDDLIANKLKSARPKDILDIQQLQRIRNEQK